MQLLSCILLPQHGYFTHINLVPYFGSLPFNFNGEFLTVEQGLIASREVRVLEQFAPPEALSPQLLVVLGRDSCSKVRSTLPLQMEERQKLHRISSKGFFTSAGAVPGMDIFI